jgi:hypothetical protein
MLPEKHREIIRLRDIDGFAYVKKLMPKHLKKLIPMILKALK